MKVIILYRISNINCYCFPFFTLAVLVRISLCRLYISCIHRGFKHHLSGIFVVIRSEDLVEVDLAK